MDKDIGRYQAIAMGITSAFVIDTKEGHLWLWGPCEQTGVTLMYLGQLSIGKEPGDIIIQTLNKEEV